MASQTTKEFDVRRYWGVVLKHRYLILAIFLVVASGFTWGSFFWPESYEASSTVFVQRSAVMDPLIKGVGVATSMEERLRTIKDRLISRNIIERVIKKLDMDVYARTPDKYESLIENVRSSLAITIKTPRGKETADLFTIAYTGPDPRKARDIVNTLVSEYIEENLGFRRSDAYGAFEFIQSQLMEYKAKLEESDKQMREFREKHPSMIPQSEATLLGRVENFQTAKIETEIRLKELTRRRDNLKKQISGEKELTVAMVTREGSPQSRLNYLSNQIVLLSAKFTDNHPEIIKIKGEIEELKREIARAKDAPPDTTGSETSTLNPIYQQLKEDLAKTDAEIESLRARAGELARQQQTAQGILGSMPKGQEEWMKLMRDRNVYQKIYDDLLQKLEQARVSKDLELTDKSEAFRVVDPAVLPVIPVKPDRVKLILMGIGLGLAAGFGAALALEALSPSFKDDDSIETVLKLPVLASIQRIEVADAKLMAAKRMERKIFAAAGAYVSVILLVLIKEALYRYMGITIISF
ncbi:MAG: XrtA system polysaccharide chain length determinant [Nitrospirota bacterium]